MSTLLTPQLAQRNERLIGSIIDASTAILAEYSHDIVRFAMGAPNEELVPTQQLSEAFQAAVPGRFDYGETEGQPELREQIAQLSQTQGNPTHPDRILVTTGGMQGLDLAFKLCVDPGDLVIIETPTYTNGYATALSYGADVLAAPMDEHGLIVEQLPELVRRSGKTPRLIYTIPNFQNPSGVSLSLERRQQLLELADSWGAIILEDDPYGALRFEGEEVASFAQLAPQHPALFQVRTFSKTIAPGLRTGWIDVDPSVLARAVNAKQAMDTCTSVPVQTAVSHYLASGAFETHVQKLRPIYRERKQAMQRILLDTFGTDVSFTDPEGGFFLWATLAGKYEHLNTEDLFRAALEAGVAYIPGPAFTSDGSMGNALRLCFATSSPERIATGIERLHTVLEQAVV